MTTITTRSGKGSPLTNDEVDANFTGLNSDKVEASGDSMTGDLSFGDNNKVILGTGNDLQIYHNGSNSYIDDAGTGSLVIRSNAVNIGKYTGETAAVFTADGSVQLRYDNSAKFETTSTGIDVTGTAVIKTGSGNTYPTASTSADNLVISDKTASTPVGITIFSDNASQGNIFFGDENDADNGRIVYDHNGNVNTMSFYANGAERLSVNSTGIDVTGTVTADALTVDGSTTLNSAGATTLTLQRNSGSDSNTVVAFNQATADSYIGADSSNSFVIGNNLNLGVERRAEFAQNGDISFYEDTGTTAKLFWDASAESLGLGVSSPQKPLHVYHATIDNVVRVESGDSRARIEIADGDTTVVPNIGVVGNNFTVDTNGSERLSVNSTGIDVTGDIVLGDNNPSITLNDSSIANLQHTIVSASNKLQISTDPNGVHSSSRIEFLVDNTEHLQVTSTGIDVTGSISADGLTVAGTGVVGSFDRTDNNAIIELKRSGSVKGYIGADTGGDVLLYNGSAVQKLRIGSGGDISFYEDTGTTAKLFWDASAESLGLGTSSPSNPLHVATASTDVAKFATTGAYNFITLDNATRNWALSVGSTFSIYDSTAASTRMSVDSSGNLLVGKTSAAIAGAGTAILSSGTHNVTVNGDTTLQLNRLSSPGPIATFFADGGTVGSIGTRANYIKVGNGDTQLLFNSASDAITPEGSTDNRNGFIDLGRDVSQFKDLYLSGGVVFGATGGNVSSKTLDDYEEGTFSPVLADATTGGNASSTGAEAFYTKIGQQVFLTINFYNINTTGLTSGNDIFIQALPFVAKSISGAAYYTGTMYSSVLSFTRTENCYPLINDNASYLRLGFNRDGAGFDGQQVNGITSGSTDMTFNISYMTA
jgi:hypothetical protein